jgi:biopolymer transport protein ExbD
MAKKKGRVNIHIDMTPMVDITMLLLTFFMLTTQFRPPSEAEVTLPTSHSAIELPRSDVMTVTITQDGRLFLGLDSQHVRAAVFGEENKLRQGMELPSDLPTAQKMEMLEQMMVKARMANLKLRTVVKGDKGAPYGPIEDVLNSLARVQITRFSLVTDLERS